MKILVIYATVEGQTARIAGFVRRELDRLGHHALLADAADSRPLSFEGVDAAVLAASVHQRRHPRSFEALLAAERDNLARIPTLMLSVSLSAAFPEGREEAADYLTEMEMRTRFTPTDRLLVAGAVRNAHYDYYAAQVVRHVVLRDRPFDDAREDHEFTDWQELSEKLAVFVARDQALTP